MTTKSTGGRNKSFFLEPQRVEFIVLGITVATLIGGAFLLGFNAGYTFALMKLLP